MLDEWVGNKKCQRSERFLCVDFTFWDGCGSRADPAGGAANPSDSTTQRNPDDRSGSFRFQETANLTWPSTTTQKFTRGADRISLSKLWPSQLPELLTRRIATSKLGNLHLG